MSGGPYGRGKAPERACLPVDRWPEVDACGSRPAPQATFSTMRLAPGPAMLQSAMRRPPKAMGDG